MSTYTADDFAKARFATDKSGWNVACRDRNQDDLPWMIGKSAHRASDKDLARSSWTPVQEGRPLTADDISEQMVTRFMLHEYGISEQEAVSDEWADDRSNARESLTAALTEPPARPEGAEEIEDLLADWFGENDSPDQSNRDLADYLVRKGVRVTGSES